MNKLGIFVNFWEKDWAVDYKKYLRKASDIGFDILEFQAQPVGAEKDCGRLQNRDDIQPRT